MIAAPILRTMVSMRLRLLDFMYSTPYADVRVRLWVRVMAGWLASIFVDEPSNSAVTKLELEYPFTEVGQLHHVQLQAAAISQLESRFSWLAGLDGKVG